MIYHLVLFKMKPTATRKQVAALERSWRGLRRHIPGLRSVEGGANISIENLAKGFNRAYVITFTNEKARNTYVSHPKHAALAHEKIRPIVDDVIVADVKA